VQDFHEGSFSTTVIAKENIQVSLKSLVVSRRFTRKVIHGKLQDV